MVFAQQAYKRSVYYPGYAWIIIDNFIDNDWYTVSDTDCSLDEIKRVLQYSISIGTSPGNSRSEITLYAYDAVMAIAIALNRSRELDEPDNNISTIVNELRMLNFNGVSVSI